LYTCTCSVQTESVADNMTPIASHVEGKVMIRLRDREWDFCKPKTISHLGNFLCQG